MVLPCTNPKSGGSAGSSGVVVAIGTRSVASTSDASMPLLVQMSVTIVSTPDVDVAGVDNVAVTPVSGSSGNQVPPFQTSGLPTSAPQMGCVLQVNSSVPGAVTVYWPSRKTLGVPLLPIPVMVTTSSTFKLLPPEVPNVTNSGPRGALLFAFHESTTKVLTGPKATSILMLGNLLFSFKRGKSFHTA